MRNKNSGFTLVELLIVIFLLAIVSAIGAASWNRYIQNTNFRAAAREIEADIKQMKENKITNPAIVHTITFNVGLNNYTKAGVVNETKSPSSFGASIHLSAVNLGGASVITFTDRGLLAPNTGNIVLKNNPDRNSTATITFSATGRTYVTFDMQ
jgi:prepilin-type N-terminal cleavage/methylation domain-containing protein